MKQRQLWDRIVGWGVTLLLIASTFVLEKMPPRFTEFFEGDPALSYSSQSTVPYHYVIIFCYVVPTLLLCFFIAVRKPRFIVQWIHDTVYLSSRTFAVNEVLTAMLKNFIGRPRPCFFNLCEYEKTTVATAAGNITTFGTFGKLGNVEKCHAALPKVYSAFRSFPSGHSSTAISALIIILLQLYRFIDCTFIRPQYEIRIIKTAFTLPLVIWASFIMGSRIFDYRHRPEDVMGGVICGVLSSSFVWFLHFSKSESPLRSSLSQLFLFDPLVSPVSKQTQTASLR